MLFSWIWIVMAASMAAGAAPTAAERACRVDADCVIAPLDCCGCAAGGRGVAVNKKQLARYTSRHDRACGTSRKCLAVMSSDWSCTGTPVCVARSCQIAWAIGGACARDEDCASLDVEAVCAPRKLKCAPARCLKGACSILPRY